MLYTKNSDSAPTAQPPRTDGLCPKLRSLLRPATAKPQPGSHLGVSGPAVAQGDCRLLPTHGRGPTGIWEHHSGYESTVWVRATGWEHESERGAPLPTMEKMAGQDSGQGLRGLWDDLARVWFSGTAEDTRPPTGTPCPVNRTHRWEITPPRDTSHLTASAPDTSMIPSPQSTEGEPEAQGGTGAKGKSHSGARESQSLKPLVSRSPSIK